MATYVIDESGKCLEEGKGCLVRGSRVVLSGLCSMGLGKVEMRVRDKYCRVMGWILACRYF